MNLKEATVDVMPEKHRDIKLTPHVLQDLPARKGLRPKTLPGPLHVQCSGHGHRKYLDQLVRDVLCWPHVEALPDSSNPPTTIQIRFQENVATLDSAPFISAREFARVLLGAPTIYLALPLVCAHWAIVRGWAEPHYLSSFGLMPAGAVVVYTPKDREELSVCYALFHVAYDSALAMNGRPTGTALSGMKTVSFPGWLTTAEA
ncbi:MAG: hypothetical protein JO170_04270 [Verrucomicrobia bacterium]|nr:hypothetical protein [Verrucomicrobiota bacterium]